MKEGLEILIAATVLAWVGFGAHAAVPAATPADPIWYLGYPGAQNVLGDALEASRRIAGSIADDLCAADDPSSPLSCFTWSVRASRDSDRSLDPESGAEAIFGSR